MKVVLILLGITFLSQSIFCQCDSIVFSSEKFGMHILTQNPDSIKYFAEKIQYPNPFGPSSYNFSAFVNPLETTNLEIRIKDVNENCIVKFIWNKISPGSYRIDWWEYMYSPPTGVYYVEKIIGNNSTSHKVVFIR